MASVSPRVASRRRGGGARPATSTARGTRPRRSRAPSGCLRDRAAPPGPAVPSSGSGTGRPTRSASWRTASGNVTFSYSSTNLITSPPTPQPKHLKIALVEDVERRRLLAVERAQPLPRRAAALERARAPARSARCRRATSARRGSEAERGMVDCRVPSISTTVTPPPPCSGGAAANCVTNGCACRKPAMARRSWPVP